MKTLKSTLLFVVLFCLVATNALAVEIELEQWDRIQAVYKQPVGAKVTTLQQSLDSAEDIYKASQQIKILAQQANVSAKQLHQLTKWRRAEAVIKIPSDDHPGQWMTIVDIAAEAKAAINTMKSRTVANELYEKWNSNNFIFQDLESFTGRAGQGAFLTFFNRLPPVLKDGFTDWSLAQLKENHKTANSNYNFVLYHLANRSQNMEVAEYLLSQPVNEDSHRFITTLADYFEPEAQLALLKQAAENPKMRSQSFNGLAQHFPHDASAALVIAEALQDKESYWTALTVVPAFVKADNKSAFENVRKKLAVAQQKQLDMRLMRGN